MVVWEAPATLFSPSSCSDRQAISRVHVHKQSGIDFDASSGTCGYYCEDLDAMMRRPYVGRLPLCLGMDGASLDGIGNSPAEEAHCVERAFLRHSTGTELCVRTETLRSHELHKAAIAIYSASILTTCFLDGTCVYSSAPMLLLW